MMMSKYPILKKMSIIDLALLKRDIHNSILMYNEKSDIEFLNCINEELKIRAKDSNSVNTGRH